MDLQTEKPVCEKICTPDGVFHGWMIFCPGCHFAHVFDRRWAFNGDQYKPTFSGSYLQHGNPGGSTPRCHNFVEDGKIRFLVDCEHALAGKTVELKPVDAPSIVETVKVEKGADHGDDET